MVSSANARLRLLISFYSPLGLTPSLLLNLQDKLGISTDSSCRSARSVDLGLTLDGLNLATWMILVLCGGEASSVVSAGNLGRDDTKISLNYQDKRVWKCIYNQLMRYLTF